MTGIIMSARLRLIICNVICWCLALHFQLAHSLITTTTTDVNNIMSPITFKSRSFTPKVITISEKVWRNAASNHSQRIRTLLQPGLTPIDHALNSGRRKQSQRRYADDWTGLDPINPIYNFLIEYYGLKGAKGPRRLARWAPDPKLLLADGDDSSTQQYFTQPIGNVIYTAAMKASHGLGGIVLENANLDDLGTTLHLRGSVPIAIDGAAIDTNNSNNEHQHDPVKLHGILYNPAVFYNRHIPISHSKDDERRQQLLKTIAPFQWYSSILQTTLNSEPILHCYGLHEWAMQYQPEGADPPPSAKYQSSLNLRVSREVINETVERKGISCTHVDALRFFAPAAGPLNHHGASLERMDQLRLEQKGCVHAQMDLLKIGLKLQSFIDSELMVDILQLALAARKLDVEASPYDATAYGAGIIPVETNEGRKLYRDEQISLMQKAEPVRKRLLDAYNNVFMDLAFDESLLGRGSDSVKTNADGAAIQGNNQYVAPERISRAEPGGLPWRKNLIE